MGMRLTRLLCLISGCTTQPSTRRLPSFDALGPAIVTYYNIAIHPMLCRSIRFPEGALIQPKSGAGQRSPFRPRSAVRHIWSFLV
mgnify:CR=1 FL=1